MLGEMTKNLIKSAQPKTKEPKGEKQGWDEQGTERQGRGRHRVLTEIIQTFRNGYAARARVDPRLMASPRQRPRQPATA